MSSKSAGVKPTDRYNIIYIVFIILGTASTLPVHIFYTASSYYKAKLKGTRYEHVIENYLMLAYSLPTLFMGVINLMLLRSFDVRKRLAFSVIMLIIFFTATAILAKLDTTKWKMTFFILSLTIISLNSVFGSTIYQGSLFGLASIFPKEYAQALITGQALAGVFTAIVNILSLIASHSASHSGVAYFICGIILLLVSLIIQLLLKKNAFARYYMELNLEYDTYQRKKLLSHEDEFSETDEEHERVPNEDSRIYRIKHIINKTWPVVLAYFFCHTITFCVFPSISSRAVSVYHQSHSKLTGPLFIPVACFVVFAVADVVGRLISRWILMPSQNQGLSLLFMSISRISLIPLFLYCNVKPRQHLPVKIYSDIAYIILILLLGISHGYVGTLCAMYAPKRVQARFSESAGALAYFALIAGVATGTAISFGLIAII